MGRKIRQRRLLMKPPRASRRFQAKPSHNLESALLQGGAIRRKKNPRVALRHFQCRQKESLEILLHLKSSAAMSPGKSWRIQNNDVELLAFSGQSRQHRHDVVGDEPV